MTDTFTVQGATTLIHIQHGRRWVSATIDTADLNKARSFPGTWSVLPTRHGLYAKATIRDPYVASGSTTIYLHRYILNVDPRSLVRHRNRNLLDSRRANLSISSSRRARSRVAPARSYGQ